MRFVRALTGVLAVVLCGWFALGVRQAHDLSRAEAIVSSSSGLSARQARPVQSLLQAASTLNPDQRVNLVRGEVAALESQTPRAARIFAQVADREPLNINAWLLLAQADYGQGAPLARALSHIGQLDHQMKSSG